ncbi:PhpK family radical SAM P-methyltransferase [Acinetobacter pittii]|uniref:PhpK family radical SAM P-methyltransferase n=1 Tax=Acinetobacter pittii TaxID=48296 RepID=UPI0021D34024|nr:PhpK family radical SAM P-methyltransferase [Acinetobacter pittii]MCU4528180.1 PhpK family radical SAM P-methyltransferase [Acinetobacter pittii]
MISIDKKNDDEVIDCMLIGFNDFNFDSYVESLKVMGNNSVSYRDANLSFIEHQGKKYRALDFLNKYSFFKGESGGSLDNGEFLWPVITYLGTYLHRKGLTFDYVRLFHQDKAKLEKSIKNRNILTIAITTTVYVTPEPIIEIIDFIRSINPKIKIIVGGPYLAGQPELLDEESLNSLLDYIGADYYIFSAEGEATLGELITAIKKDISIDHISNLAFRSNGDFVRTNLTIESNSLEENMINYKLFSKSDIGQFVSVRTAKSCPFSCAFCGFPERAGKYKYLSLEYVEKELDNIKDIGGVSTITFIDDTFNVPKTRFKEILRLMIRKKYGFKWNSYLRSDHVDDEALTLMAESGCEGVFLGVESGSDKILKKMNKTSSQAHYRRVISRCRELNIITYASLIIGFPGEDADTVSETLEFLDSVKPDFFRAQVWYADPITPVYRNGEKYGLKGEGFSWVHNTMNALQAADYVEKIFLSVKGSKWLPQNGFEPWSLYYLQRRGMSMSQILSFLDNFNSAIKVKLKTGNLEVGQQDFDELIQVVSTAKTKNIIKS